MPDFDRPDLCGTNPDAARLVCRSRHRDGAPPPRGRTMRRVLPYLWLCLFGCRGPTRAQTTDAGGALSPEASGSPARLPALAASWIERLDAPSGVVWVAPPVGSTEPRPIVVAVHGAMDDPGLMCSAWRLIADVYPFVVCPGGTPVRGTTHVWPSSDAVDRAVTAAVTAVRAKYGAYVADGPLVYTAFSQGANLAGPVLARRSAERPPFARAVLTEGGYRVFETRAAASAFLAAGGERVLFTCSQGGCAAGFQGSRATLEAAGARARVSYAGPHGHSLPPAAREAIHAELPWLVEGLKEWETYATAPKLDAH